jgi:hypothetical protein
MSRTIPCTCDPDGRLRRLPRRVLQPFQRELKTLTTERYERLRMAMDQHGFIAPVFVWASPSGFQVLDGHQRLAVLEREDWEVEDGVPVVDIVAATPREAAEKLLLLTSHFAEIEPQGLYEFGEIYGLDLSTWDLPALPGIDWPDFRAEFFDTDGDLPGLPNGDRPPLRQMTFTLHETQAEQVERALEAVKALGDFDEALNENSNGNALARVCETFLTVQGDGNG